MSHQYPLSSIPMSLIQSVELVKTLCGDKGVRGTLTLPLESSAGDNVDESNKEAPSSVVVTTIKPTRTLGSGLLDRGNNWVIQD